jgi:gamma-glutamyl hydrolase
MRQVVVVVITTLIALAAASPKQPADPVLGIITHPIEQCNNPPNGTGPYDQCVESYYARWLEDAGIRIVAIPFNASWETQMWWLQRVNGVLFQGGGVSNAQLGPYIEATTRIIKYAIDGKAKGDPLVVWGTCMGFQILAAAAAGSTDVIQCGYPNMYPAMLPVNFTLAQPSSRLLGDASAPHDVRETMLSKNSTLNWHDCIVTPDSFAQYSNLSAIFTPLTTNIVPQQTQEFVSAFESPVAEIYATQFHPERPPYEFSNDGIGHTLGDLSISQYLADFIVSRLRMNNHSFDSADQFERNRLGKWPLVDQGYGTRTYYIEKGDPVK